MFFFTPLANHGTCEHISAMFLLPDNQWGRSLSDGDGADDDSVLQHDTDDEEDKVQQEHEKAQKLAHSPLAGRDGYDDKEEHEEEEDDGTEQAVAAHFYRLEVVEDVVDEPGEWKTGGKRSLITRDGQHMFSSKNGYYTPLLRCVFYYCSLDSPHSDIKDVGAHRAGHGHVTEALSCHNHAGYQVRD